MKKLITILVAAFVLATSTLSFANPEAENGVQQPRDAKQKKKAHGYDLVMKVDEDGKKTLYRVKSGKRWSAEQFKANVVKLEAGSLKATVAQVKTAGKSGNDEAETKGAITSWYYYGGYYTPCYGNWWGGYGASWGGWYGGYGWGGYPSCGYYSGCYGYGHYSSLYYRPVAYGHAHYYYYPNC
jgi:hypothetical protein